ncbi:MAG: hypothetical protein IMF08_09450 [Proteobacteria bacterium]|nr:hypothetical protein [Pseudomonadota bacterium]
MISGKNGSVDAIFGNLEIDRFVRNIFVGPKYVMLAFAMGGAGNWADHASMAKLNFWVGYIVEPWSPDGYLQEPIFNLAFGFAGALAGVLAATILCMTWKHVLFVLLMFLAGFAFYEFSLFGGLGAMLAPGFWIFGQFAMVVGAACAFLPALGVRLAIGYAWRRWRDKQSKIPPGTGRAA